MEKLIYFFIVMHVTINVFRIEIANFLMNIIYKLKEWEKKIDKEESERLEKERSKDYIKYF